MLKFAFHICKMKWAKFCLNSLRNQEDINFKVVAPKLHPYLSLYFSAPGGIVPHNTVLVSNAANKAGGSFN